MGKSRRRLDAAQGSFGTAIMNGENEYFVTLDTILQDIGPGKSAKT